MKIRIIELVEKYFDITFVDFVPKQFADCEISLTKLSKNEELLFSIETFNEICANTLSKSGPRRKEQWELGWQSSGIFLDENISRLPIPLYFTKNNIIRLKGELYNIDNKYAEIYILRVLQNFYLNAAKKEFVGINCIAEYGCGTGHNLDFLNQIGFGKENLYGYDWAESAIDRIKKCSFLEKSNFDTIDYFDKLSFKSPNKEFIAFTFASLEQTGVNFKNFMNYLFDNENCVGGLHIEPIWELLPNTSTPRLISRLYCQNRNYLTGFFDFMKLNEEFKNIKILNYNLNGFGSKFIEGYIPIIWKKNGKI